MMESTHVLAFVGMNWEARIARGPGVLVLCKSDSACMGAAFARAASDGCAAAISFGVAGGLDPELRAGDCVVGCSIIDGPQFHAPNLELSRRLLDLLPDADFAPIIGVNQPVLDPVEKRAMHQRARAVAVDMESHLVARLAKFHGLHFVALRIVIDPAGRALSPTALRGLGGAGGTDVMPVLRGLLARPRDAAGIARLAWDAFIALGALRSTRLRLGNSFGIMGRS